MSAFRLPHGGEIDRRKEITFSFNGQKMIGYAGDTLASALLANGRVFVARSFKYHRPRGIVGHGSEEPNALVTLRGAGGRTDPNTRATTVELTEGLDAWSQNHWPSLAFDVGALADRLAPILGAGFYYKTFMWPPAWWRKVYEPAIRAAAGLGRAPELPDPDRYQHRHAHCDVLVVGAGSAGIAAAQAAAERGARVILADEHVISAMQNITVLSRATVFGIYGHNHAGIVERVAPIAGRDLPRERLWQVRAREIVVAAGAHERPLVFEDNDRPGIMLAESARVYAVRYGVAPGHRVVIATCGDSAYAAARDMLSAGVKVVALINIRPDAEDAASLRALGVEVLTGHTITGSEGRHRVSALKVISLQTNKERRIACDCVAMHGGWTPAVHLHSQARGKLRFDAALDAFLPDGDAAGVRTILPSTPGFTPVRVLAGAARRAFVDFQNDVTAKDIGLALQEGFESIEHVKRYTTTGMATDQGKTSNMNALGLVAERLARPVPQVGITTFRPPYTPVTFGALIGAHRGALFDPVRETPSHAWARARGALFEEVGQWKRALAFPKAGEDLHAAVARECRTVRTTAGLFDASTLGKIDVRGRDALEFLNRMYVNSFDKLEPGRCRYALMLREDGYVYDDGIVARLAPHHFHVTTTTGGAARVLAMMEDYLQTEWSELQVYLTSITEQYAVLAVQGPQAGALVAPFTDISGMPPMSVRSGSFAGVPCRLFSVSFTGEPGFEINVPWGHGAALWAQLAEHIAPYGTETMHVLRAERGFIIVGQETDGTMTPHDLGLEGMIGKAKPDFVGKRSLARPDMALPERKQLVGLHTDDPSLVLEDGAQLVADPRQAVSIGHVTSSYRSANCGRSIALAMVAGGRARLGRTLHATTPGGFAPAKVVKPVFL